MNNGLHEELLRASLAPQQPMTTTSTILRFVAEASADSPGGRVAAGTVMKWIDEAAAVVAHQWAKSPCVAASFGKIRFAHPVVAGALVEVEARLAYTGTTSMNIFIEVRSGPQTSEAYQEVTHCAAVFVSPDEHGTPAPWTPGRPKPPATWRWRSWCATRSRPRFALTLTLTPAWAVGHRYPGRFTARCAVRSAPPSRRFAPAAWTASPARSRRTE